MKLQHVFRQLQRCRAGCWSAWLSAGVAAGPGLPTVSQPRASGCRGGLGGAYLSGGGRVSSRSFPSVQDAESAQRGFVVSGNESLPRAVQPGDARLARATRRAGQAHQRQPGRAGAAQEAARGHRPAARARPHSASTSGGSSASAALEPKYLNGAGVRLMDVVRADVGAMIDAENRLLQERLRRAGAGARPLGVAPGARRRVQHRVVDRRVRRSGQADVPRQPRRSRKPAAATRNSATRTTNCARSRIPSRTTCARRCARSTDSRRCSSRITRAKLDAEGQPGARTHHGQRHR